MKVLLINPPSPFLLDERVVPTLGVLQVAAALEDHGHDVKVEDLSGISKYSERMAAVASEGWDCYGISATTPQYPVALEILSRIREVDPGKRVVLGGAHATLMPESCGPFDCVVMGDGEQGILDAIKPDAPVLIDYASNTKKGEVHWRWPARHLIDMDSYDYRLGGVKATSVMLSQACPFSCSFCGGRLSPYYRRVRTRLTEDVVREMEHLIDRYGIRGVMAYDDEVNLLNEPLVAFCRAIKPLGMKFRAFVKANLFNDLQAEAMAEAGFIEVCTGVEAGDDRILGIINKQTTREINKKFVQTARKYGMRVKCFCSIGHPGEDYESAENLKSWIIDAAPDDFDVTVISVYAGTPLWAEREHIGVGTNGLPICRYVKKSKNPRENGATLYFEEVDFTKTLNFYKGMPGSYVSHVWTPELSVQDMVRLRDEIEADARKALNIPYPKRYSGDQYEHTMGTGTNTQDSRVELRSG